MDVRGCSIRLHRPWPAILGGLVAGVLFAASVAAAPMAAVHVAPDGDNAADGAEGRPVATLRRALDIVRDLRKRRTADREIVVEVADGASALFPPAGSGPGPGPGAGPGPDA